MPLFKKHPYDLWQQRTLMENWWLADAMFGVRCKSNTTMAIEGTRASAPLQDVSLCTWSSFMVVPADKVTHQNLLGHLYGTS